MERAPSQGEGCKSQSKGSVKHDLISVDQPRAGYATLTCPQNPTLKMLFYKVVERCPICGNHDPLRLNIPTRKLS